MRRERPPLARALALALALTVAGCASTERQRPTHITMPGPSQVELQAAATIGSTIELQQRLIQGGPAEQAEMLASARSAYEQTPRSSTQLRYALALAAPQHPARDPVLAQKLLRELLSAPESLLPLERSLALIESQRVDAELRLVAEQERLALEAERERNRDRGAAATAALNRRLQTEMDENARLRKALDEARAKLDAIATIEQNIGERKPTTEGRRP
ncbi:MAG: hypothetical protein EOP61_31070 [Sphingomonadales bacterium]|nr:MAG: hypothetical protein EOP61_31070 [Sphingomonadales bacterium]